MNTFFLFISQNFIAVTLLLLSVTALIIYEGRKGGKKLSPGEATRKINKEIFINILEDKDWIELARSALLKKAKGKDLNDKQIEVKIKQFLNYRGFNFLQIDKAFESVKRNEMVDGQT